MRKRLLNEVNRFGYDPKDAVWIDVRLELISVYEDESKMFDKEVIVEQMSGNGKYHNKFKYSVTEDKVIAKYQFLGDRRKLNKGEYDKDLNKIIDTMEKSASYYIEKNGSYTTKELALHISNSIKYDDDYDSFIAVNDIYSTDIMHARKMMNEKVSKGYEFTGKSMNIDVPVISKDDKLPKAKIHFEYEDKLDPSKDWLMPKDVSAYIDDFGVNDRDVISLTVVINNPSEADYKTIKSNLDKLQDNLIAQLRKQRIPAGDNAKLDDSIAKGYRNQESNIRTIKVAKLIPGVDFK